MRTHDIPEFRGVEALFPTSLDLVRKLLGIRGMPRARTLILILALATVPAGAAFGGPLKVRRADRVQRAADSARRSLVHSARVRRLFGLTRPQIHKALKAAKIQKGASRYESRGWASTGRGGKGGARRAKSPRKDTIVISPLLGPKSAAAHESRHALHHAVASTLFVASTPRELASTLRRVKRGILGDAAFAKHIKANGTDAQGRTLKLMERLVRRMETGAKGKRRGDRLLKLARGRAGELGALVYQHAYFVDPGMCEAAASFGDRGFTRLVTGLNGIAGRAGLGKLPGAGYLAGYGNKRMQQQFRAASPWQKALLVPKAAYDRGKFFGDAK